MKVSIAFLFFADEEDNLSEDEVSANPVEGKYNLFQIQIKPK
jgi:hypothetical protein